MAAVRAMPPPLPDRSGRPPPPALNTLPSRSRGGSEKTPNANINRPLPAPPSDHSSSSPRLKIPNDQGQRRLSQSKLQVDSVSPYVSKTLPKGFKTDQIDTGARAPSGHVLGTAPPPLPPLRADTVTPTPTSPHSPAKSSNRVAPTKVVKKGYEQRFMFHKLAEFPEPDDFSGKKKRYTSVDPEQNEKMLDDFLRNQENKLHRLFLGKDKSAKLHICAVFEEKSKNIPHSFKNVPVMSKRRSDNNYSALKAMYGHNGSIPDDEKQEMEEILRLRSDELMQTHSNLEILTISPSKFKDKSEEFVEEPCFVMYCTFKGIIPINENPFPKTIDKWPVDVREGMFYLLPGNGDVTFPSSVSYFKQVQMGCNIGAANGRKNGTLGGFVDCPKNGLCFITCAHVLHDITVTNPNIPQSAPLTPHVSVVQPGPSQPNAELCGHEVMSYFGTTSSGVTVDASLVKVLPYREPDRGNFAGLTMDDLEIIGFDGKESPEYSNGAIKTTLDKGDRLQHLIKCGTNTGITRGTLNVKGTCVRSSEYAISFNTQQTNGFYAKQQYEIIPPGGRPFANVGDSGSFVFMLDKDENLHCIGMLIGVTNLFTGIVTPIGDILNTFNIPHQNMHCFTSDPMQE